MAVKHTYAHKDLHVNIPKNVTYNKQRAEKPQSPSTGEMSKWKVIDLGDGMIFNNKGG